MINVDELKNSHVFLYQEVMKSVFPGKKRPGTSAYATEDDRYSEPL